MIDRPGAQRWISWTFIAVLAISCGLLGVLQYRWIGEIGDAERDRMRQSLRSRMDSFARAFDNEISTAVNALVPDEPDEQSWRNRYQDWQRNHPQIFRQISLAYPRDGELRLLQLEPATDAPSSPVSRDVLRPNDPATLALEVFGQPNGPVWLILQFHTDYIGKVLAPRLVSIYLGEEGTLDYDAEITTAGSPPHVIYLSGNAGTAELYGHADASVALLNIQAGGRGRGPGPGFPFGRGRGRGPSPGPGPGGRRGPPPSRDSSRGMWQLSLRHHAGSLEALVAGTQRRNLAVSGGVLLLIVMASALLLVWSRSAQRLAALQMEFVAGVSHELRTPLTVIRTAAFNLRNPDLRARPDHVEKYGQLIESETSRLEKMMEQVLRFAGLSAGHPLTAMQSFLLTRVIREEIDARRADVERQNIEIEEHLADLPPIRGDLDSLRHVVRNLIDNALKHGASGKWIRVSAATIAASDRNWVEIRVSDRGPGVPRGEQKRIFDAFYRGSGATRDQIRGNGLGLSLARMVVSRHGGSIRVESGEEGGAEFILRIPA